MASAPSVAVAFSQHQPLKDRMAPTEHSPATAPFDPKVLGKRLAEARNNTRLTQEQAADELGLLRTAIAQIETGARAVSSDELVRLARLYNRSIDSFFEAEQEAVVDDALTVLARMAPVVHGDAQTAKTVGALIDVCRAGASLKRELGLKNHDGPPAYEWPQPRNMGDAVEQGNMAAEHERKRLDLGEASIADIHELIARQDIWAASDHLPDDVSGLFFNHQTTGVVIVINHDHHPCRQRFSYAHEYAHALFDRKLRVTYTAKDNSTNLIEARANAFAAAFLMPKRGVELALERDDKGKPSKHLFSLYDVANEGGTEIERRSTAASQRLGVKDVARLALHFDVSYQVACFRLKSLGFINQNELNDLRDREEAARLFMRIARGDQAAGQDREAMLCQRFENHIIAQMLPLILEAYQREIISRGRLLELSMLIGVPGSTILQIAQTR